MNRTLPLYRQAYTNFSSQQRKPSGIRLSTTLKAFIPNALVRLLGLSILLLMGVSAQLKAQTISISDVKVSGCYLDASGNSKATVTMLINWTNGGSRTVQVSLTGAPSRTFQVGNVTFKYNTANCDPNPALRTTDIVQPVVSPQAISFEVNANGALLNLSAKFTDNSATSPTLNVAAPAACPRTACSAGGLGGIVFNDYDADGVRDVTGVTGEVQGVGGVAVKVIDRNGTVFNTVSDKYGYYAITGSPVYPVRVEFTNIPSAYASSSTPNGTSSRTTVQFVNAASCSVNLGVNDKLDYCQENPQLYTTCFINGDPLGGGNAGTADAIVRVGYDGSGKTTIANGSQVGATYGLAYNRNTNKIFISAIVRRHVGFGPRGIGGIYLYNVATNTVAPFIDLDNNDDDGPGGFGNIGINLGTPTSNVGRGLNADKAQPSRDKSAFYAVGTQGLGDLDISEDGNTLYTINLSTNELIRINLSAYNTSGTLPTAADITTSAIPDPGCTGGAWRPFALKYYKGKLYVGGVCDGSSTTPVAPSGYPANKANLTAVVYEYDGSSFNPVLDFPLTYPKGYPDLGSSPKHGWYPWITPAGQADDFKYWFGNGNVSYPQPIFGDIEFDLDGSMFLGFNDRTGNQTGVQNNSTDDAGHFVNGWQGGDLLKAYASGGVFLVENNGKAGPFQGYGANNGEGIGFGEYFNDDFCAGPKYHSETFIGGLAVKPGSGQVVGTSMDPADNIAWSAGFRYMNSNTGQRDDAVIIYQGASGLGGGGPLGKSAGLGDVEILCSFPTYLQIGNRVWEDIDKDGIQDPTEPGLQGVVVRIYKLSDNSQVGSTTTNSSGEYYFNVDPNTDYYITFGQTQQVGGNTNRITLASKVYTVTQQDVGEGSAIEKDLNDSDVRLGNVGDKSNVIFLQFKSGAFTEDNHTYDAGFSGCYATLTATSSTTQAECVGLPVNLSSSVSNTSGPVTYSWGGPNSFASTQQNPSFTPDDITDGGSYTVTVTETSPVNVCTYTTTVDVKLKVCCTTPTLSASNNGPVCEGGTLTLNVTTNPVSPAQGVWTYTWNGPSFTSNVQNPAVNPASPANSGNFVVTVANVFGGITCSATAQTQAVVNASPKNAQLTTNSPRCAGETINLNLSVVDAGSYSWAGPAGFNSTQQNPTRTTSINTTLGDGVYSVTIYGTASTCSLTLTTSVRVNPRPTVAPTTLPVCEGTTLSLTSNAAGGTAPLNYSWSGPGSFTSTDVNPSRPNALPTMSGGYSVTVSDPNSCTVSASVVATVWVTPKNPVLTSNSPRCAGETINISLTVLDGDKYSWSGPAGFTSTEQNPTRTTSIATTLGDGVYSVTIYGTASTCSLALTTSVRVNPRPTATPSTTPVCEGGNLILAANAAGGTPPLNYRWDGPGGFTSTDVAPLRPNALPTMSGGYTVTVSDPNSCSVTASVIATVWPRPIPSIIGSATCANKPLLLNSAVQSGTSPFSYTWSGPGTFTSTSQASTSVTGLPAGFQTFNLQVSDVHSCTGTASIRLQIFPVPDPIAQNAFACEGTPLQLSVTEHNLYFWSSPQPGMIQFGSQAQFPTLSTSIAPGGYTFTVTVANIHDCRNTTTAAIRINARPQVSATGATLCAGETLNLSSTITGGSSPYSFGWSGPSNFSSGAQNPALGAATTAMSGNYSITVRDQNSCTSSAIAAVQVKPNPMAIAQGGSACLGQPVGLTASGGGTYSWQGPGSFNNAVQSPSVTGLGVGQHLYSVTVSREGCTASTTAQITIYALPSVSAQTQAICAGNTLSLSASASGGQPAYTYAWNSSVGFTSSVQAPSRPDATASMSGVYSVSVTDNRGCTASAVTTATVNVNPVANAVSNSPLCVGSQLNLSASASPTGSYGFTWSGPGFNTNTQNPFIPNVTTAQAGVYSVTIRDNTTSCSVTAQVSVSVNAQGANLTSNSPVCVGKTITFNATTGGSSYSWAGPNGFTANSSNPSIPNASLNNEGTYSVTVIGTGGCSGTASTFVDVQEVPIAGGAGAPNPSCQGTPVNLSASGGSVIAWNGPGFFSSYQSPNPTVTGLPAGNHIFTVTIGVGACTATAQVPITVYERPSVQIIASPVCAGQDLVLTAAISGGLPFYAFQWTSSNGFASTQQSPVRNNASVGMSGNYAVQVTDSRSCTATANVLVTINPRPSIQLSSNSPICAGTQLNLDASTSPQGSYIYSWQGPNFYISSQEDPFIPNATTAATGIYSVTVRDNNTSCSSTAQIGVQVTPQGASATSNSPVCAGQTITLNASAGGTTYSWAGPNNFTANGANPSIANATQQNIGNYTVTIAGGGCTGTAVVAVDVRPQPIITLSTSAIQNAPVCVGGNVSLSATGGTNYAWSGPNGFTANIQNPTVSNVTGNGTYTVTVTGQNGCSATGTVAVFTRICCDITVTASDNSVCEGGTISLNATNTNATVFAWAGPNGYTSNQQNPARPNATVAMNGVYTVTAYSSANSTCSATATTSAQINTANATASAASASVAQGGTISLSATGGGSYSWAGPAGFSSTQQNPTRPNATTDMSGTYTVSVTAQNGCTATAVVPVVVNPPGCNITVSASANSVCEGGTLTLVSASNGTVFAWAGPNGYTSNQQNPTRPNATVAMNGNYSVTAYLSANSTCSATALTPVTINTANATASAASASVAQGGTISLSATGGGSYSWAGPAGFSSTSATPTRPNATTDMSGTYTVSVTAQNGCTATAVVPVVVNPPGCNITVSASANSVCEGGTLTLVSASNGTVFSWSGPGGYTSEQQNPTRPNATVAMNGNYSVTAYLSANSTCSATAVTPVVIKSANATATTANASVTIGGSISLSATGGGSYSWAGPAGFSSTSATPTRPNATTDMSGTYTVTVTSTEQCTGTATVSLTVVPPPCNINVSASANSVCEGGTLTLVSASNGTVFSWAGPNGYTSNQQNPTRPNATVAMNGNYSVTAYLSANSTCSATAVTPVVIKSANATATTANASVTIGGSISLSATGGGSYSWAGPAGFSSTSATPTRPNATTDMSGTYTVTVTSTEQCTGTATVSLTVVPPPCNINVSASANSVCEGGTLTLVSASNGTVFAWAGPNGYTSEQQNPTRPNATVAMNGNYSVTAYLSANSTCSATAVTPVVIKSANATATANGTVLTGGTISLSATGGGSYSWAGPAGFSSTSATPTRPNATTDMSGTYTVTVTSTEQCTGTATVAVQVNSPACEVGLSANSNAVSPICTEQTIQLNALAVGSISGYSWSGPDGFTSTLQNPSRPNATTAMAGIYSVTVRSSLQPTCSATATAAVQIKVCLGSIGDYVWKDADQDGLQDDSEKGVKGVSIELYKTDANGNATGSPIKTTTTDDNGKYLFDQLPSGDYRVRFVLNSFPDGCILTKQDATTDDKDSDSDPNGFSPRVTIDVNGSGIMKDNPTVDAGLITPPVGSIGDYVWKDENKNGVQDSSEPGVKDVVVNLFKLNADGSRPSTPLKTMTTNADGFYKFTDLISGEYQVQFVTSSLPEDCRKLTTKDADSDDSKDSDANPADGFAPKVTINANGTGIAKDNPTIDAGIAPDYGSIGDYVWKDTNQNGLQDAGEPGVKGITVELYKLNTDGSLPSSPLKTASTDDNGGYLFDKLSIGNYKVKFVTSSFPTDCALTEANKGDDTQDSDAGPDGFSPVIPINPAGTGLAKDNRTIDAGLITLLGSIGDYVWKDTNQNGQQDAGEPGVKGISVQLFKLNADGSLPSSPLKTASTDEQGKYLFADLVAGQYKVRFVTNTFPADCILTAPNQGDDTQDSDAGPDGFTPTIPINPAGTGLAKDNLTIDAGLAPQFGSIGDYVWKDTNQNGQQDAGEAGVKGVTVELYQTDLNGNLQGPAIRTTTTDDNGKYLFAQLPSGEYRVRFVTSSLPEDCSIGQANQGDDTKDSDADPISGLSPRISINALGTGLAKDNPTIDAGLINKPLGSIGDYVWKDENKNGQQDAGEVGVKDVIVRLFKLNADGSRPTTPLKTTSTNADGFYQFPDLQSGDYQVQFDTSQLPEDCDDLTPANQGDDAKDSDANPADGFTPKVTINANGTGIAKDNPTLDAGIVPEYGSIGDYVWKDANQNGLQDAGEPGVKGITVELYKLNTDGSLPSSPLKTASTDDNGKYLFSDLVVGQYKVRFVTNTFPADCILTSANQGTDDAKDSDAGPDGFTPTIPINPAGTGLAKDNLTIDAGLAPQFGSIGDYVWKDANQNGQQDAGEAGVKGVTVELYQTDLNGNLQGPAIRTTTTDDNGKYLFAQLPSGEYRVRFVTSSLPEDCSIGQANQGDDSKDSDADPISGLSPRISINALGTGIAKDNPTIDAGLINKPLGSLGDYVWKDENKNGQQDAGEVGVKDVIVRLFKLNADGSRPTTPLKTTSTNADGFYQFSDLQSGDYQVQFDTSQLPEDCDDLTPANQGDDTKDSDANPADGFTPKVTINANGTGIAKDNPTLDAGIVPEYGSIGDYVWKDANGNGLQDSGEKGVKGITVELYKLNTDGSLPSSPLKTASTDDNGAYLFDKLSSGNYKVKFATSSFPADCVLAPANQGTDDAKDSDAGPDGFSPIIPINPAGTGLAKDNRTIDAGLVTQFGSLGDYVWKDTNQNGLQDAGEPGVKGVTVELYQTNANGTPQGAAFKTTTTNDQGFYQFTALPTGDYKVKFLAATFPKDCSPTKPDQGNDDTKDSDLGPDGFSPKVSINAEGTGLAKDNPTLDAGLAPQYGSLGDYVWLDVDRDGFQDDNESPLQGVKVELYNADKTIKLAETTTNESGKYLFAQLESGSYRVQFVPQPNTEFTKQNVALDTKDSDVDDKGCSPVVVINASGTGLDKDNPTIDAGFVIAYGSIGDYVWKDENENGRQDAGELGVKGVKVELYDAVTNLKIDEQTTNDQGYYNFDQLLTGRYKVRFTALPTDCDLIAPNQVSDDTKDSDADPVSGFSPDIPINTALPVESLGRNNPTVDAGLQFRYGSLGDYVWFDKDNDGIQEADEEPIADFTVLLFQEIAGKFIKIREAKTDAKGKYHFDKLKTGTYKVQFLVPQEWLPANPLTPENIGSNDALDSDAQRRNGFNDPEYGCTQPISINTALPVDNIGRNNPTIDGGIDPFGSIGNFVWTDQDADGIQDPNEPGVPGVKVVLLDETKTRELATTTTDDKGYYGFDKLLSGTYFVKFVLPSNSVFTSPNQLGDDTKDSDAKEDGCSDPIVMNLTLDFNDIRRNNPTIDAGILPCIKPNVSVTAIAATCVEGRPQPNAKLLVTGFEAGTRADYVIADTYTGDKIFFSAFPIPNDGIIAGNIVNPPTPYNFTVRVWSSPGCFVDKTVPMPITNCDCPPAKCVPFVIVKTK